MASLKEGWRSPVLNFRAIFLPNLVTRSMGTATSSETFWYRLREKFKPETKTTWDEFSMKEVETADTFWQVFEAYHRAPKNGLSREAGRIKAISLAEKPGHILYDALFDAPPGSVSRSMALERLVEMVKYEEEAKYLKDQLSTLEDPQKLTILSHLDNKKFEEPKGKIDWGRWIDNNE